MIKIDFSIYEKIPELAEVKSPKTFVSNKSEIFHPEGLYSEQIFGPIKNYMCQCGKLYGKINEGKRCLNCGVLCASTELRSKTFAKIKLPEGIYIINPEFIGTLSQIFGPYAIKNILNKNKYLENKTEPYYFSMEKYKLLKLNKIKQKEEILEDYSVYDITTLKKLFDYLLQIKPEVIDNKIADKRLKKYFFLNEVLILPPNSRPFIKLQNKTVVHKITSLYTKIISSKKNLSDFLFQQDSDAFGYTVYKYQKKVIDIFEEILQSNFQKKESYLRESLTGKTIEFSQRAVIIPNPALKPYEIGLHKESAEKLFLPEMLRFLYQKYKTETIKGLEIDVLEFIQRIYNFIDKNNINIATEDFIEFINKYGKEFRVMMERAPTLWKYNYSGLTIGRIYGENDMFK